VTFFVPEKYLALDLRLYSPEELSVKYLPIICTLAVSLAAGGCATKSFVRKSIDPVNGRVNDQGKVIEQTAQSLEKTRQTLEADETVLNATKERAQSADSRASDALNRAGEATTKATEASSKADQATSRANEVGRDVGTLKSQVASLDDYKKVSAVTLNFKFNSDKLDKEAMAQLDQMAANPTKHKRYFIAVEGFADKTGDTAYNAALSKRRADSVVAYLVAQHEIPVFRIQMVGLGEIKPVDEGRTAAARAKNRRVEVTFYSADSEGTVASN
jgi:OOP family OmpA-OmpF porin